MSTISREIRETRTLSFDIAPRVYRGAEGVSDFYATGVTVRDTADTAAQPNLRHLRTVRIDGYQITRAGKRSTARGALDALHVYLRYDDLSPKWYVAAEHYPAIRKLVESALDWYGIIDWEEVQP